MSEEQDDRIIIPDENGDEHLFDVIFTFDVEETNSSYMVVKSAETDENEDDDDDTEEVFGFRFEDEEGEFSLFPIETDEEWEMVEEMFNTFLAEEDL